MNKVIFFGIVALIIGAAVAGVLHIEPGVNP